MSPSGPPRRLGNVTIGRCLGYSRPSIFEYTPLVRECAARDHGPQTNQLTAFRSLLRRQHGGGFLLGKDRQTHEQQLHAGVGVQRKALPARERRILAQRLAIDRAVALQHEADLNAPARRQHGLRARIELEARDLQVALGEIAQVLLGKAGRDRFPVEVLRLEQNGFAIARLRIDELALVDVLPDRFIAVLVALLARRQLPDARKDALLEIAELLHLVDGALQPRRADKAIAAGAAELQRDAQPLAVAALRPVGRAFRKVGKLARLDPFALAVVLALALQAHADLIEIVLVAGHIDLALLPHEIEPEIVERGVVANEQRLELALRAANAADLCTIFGVGNFHGSGS